MALHLDYYDIDLDDEWWCECGTRFRVGDGMEPYDCLYDVHCPGCERMVLVVAYPTPGQTRRAAAAGNPKALADLDDANAVERRWRRIEELELKSAEQLPPLDGDPIGLELDVVTAGGERVGEERWFSVTREGREIWRELAIYEGMDRFVALRELLREAYAPRRVTLEVTDAAQRMLCGDRHWRLPAE